jgi:hypothetical protein
MGTEVHRTHRRVRAEGIKANVMTAFCELHAAHGSDDPANDNPSGAPRQDYQSPDFLLCQRSHATRLLSSLGLRPASALPHTQQTC